MSRVFSGIKPSGEMHLGNYLGAVKQWIALQQEHDCVFCVVDLHAITVPHDPKMLTEKTLNVAAFYLACGIDPEKNILFVQSQVSPHAELAWLLNTVARMSELKLMHQYKEKGRGKEENISVSLFDYPVLMAADILLYKTDIVPVGDDQMQHVELARELARRFNGRFGETFVIPKGVVPKTGARIMALDDPTKKMSKSDEGTAGYISFEDSADSMKKKIKRAVTDSGSAVVWDSKKPAISNLLEIYHALSGLSIKEIEKSFTGKGYGDFKNDLADVVVAHLEPIQKKYREYLQDKGALKKILDDGATRARSIAENTLSDAKKKMGLIE